jgi:hypothetical protein
MRAREFLPEAKKKKAVAEPVPYNPGWDNLNWLKEEAFKFGNQMTSRYQLFMPRENPAAMTRYDKRLKNLSNQYAYDENGNLKPEYEKWEDVDHNDYHPTGNEIQEGAPILTPGKNTPKIGNNKPIANLWTSSARKFDNNTWTSDWVYFANRTHPGWMSPTGYLYKIKPGALILRLDSVYDAERIMTAFQDLGSVGQVKVDYKLGPSYTMRIAFPWDAIARHFDAVWHSGYSGYDNEFMYGWDCESTAWFNSDYLQLLGEVQINQAGLSVEDE